MRSLKTRGKQLALTLAAWLAIIAPATAQSFSWVAVGGGTWNTGSNWGGGVPPTPGVTTDLIFPQFFNTLNPANNDIPGTFVLRSLTVAPGFDPFYALSGNPLQFAGVGGGLVVNGPGVGTISNAFDLAASTSVTGTDFSGSITLSGQITGSGPLVINRPTSNFLGVTALTSATANTFSGGVSLQAGILSVSQGGNVGSGPISVSTTGVGIAATGELRASATSTFNVPVNLASGATLNQNGGAQLVFGQAVNGAGGVSSGNAAVFDNSLSGMAFEAANGYSGRTDLTRSTMILRGTTGAWTGTTQIEVGFGGVLTLDSNAAVTGAGNSSGNQSSQNRIRDDAVLTFHGSTFNLVANASASTTETLGTLTGDGGNIISLTPQAATGAALTIGNLVRANGGTFDFRGTNLGGAPAGTPNSTNVFLTQINGGTPAAALVGGGGAAGTTNISIVPYFTGQGVPGTNTFLTYGANGLRLLDTTSEYASTIQPVPYSPGATNNVRGTVPLVVAGQPVTVNAIALVGNGAGVYGFGGLSGRLNVTSGAFFGSTFAIAELDFGNREAVVIPVAGIQSAIRNAAGLSASNLTLLSPNNSIAGPITVNSGSLTINSQSQLGGATAIRLSGNQFVGTLRIAPLGQGVSEPITTPINVGLAGGQITASGAQFVSLSGPLSGPGPLSFGTGSVLGVIGLGGDASGYSGPITVNSGTIRFDAPSRLGSNSSMSLGSTNVTVPGILNPTASMTIAKNLYIGGSGFVQVDSGNSVTISGAITDANGAAGGNFTKLGAGELLLTRESTTQRAVVIGVGPVISATSIVAGAYQNVGGTVTLRDRGAFVGTPSSLANSGFFIGSGSALVADNTGSANVADRISASTMNLAGGSLVLKGSPAAASSEIVGAMTLNSNTGSLVEVIPGPGQTAALFFNPSPNGGVSSNNSYVRNTGSTVTLRAPGLGGTAAGTGQINFTPFFSAVEPGLTNGILAGAFGEDSGPTPAIGFVTLDTVPAVPGFPQYRRSRLLTAGEYVLNAFPSSGNVTTNHRLTTAAAPTGNAGVNSLFLDTGGSLAITGGNSAILSSGMLIMAGGTTISGGATANLNNVAAVYVDTGAAATIGVNLNSTNVAKTGPGTLVLTAPVVATTPTYSVQRGTLRLGAGGSLPTTSVFHLFAGSTFDLNGSGGTVEFASLNGLGNIQLGTTAGTVLRVSPGAAVTSLFGGSISGTGSFEKAGAGTFVFTSSANYSGPIQLSAGTLRFGDTFASSLPIAVVAGGTISAADGTSIRPNNVQDFQRPIDVSQGAASGTVTLGIQGTGTRISGAINLAANKTLSVTAANGGVRVTGPIGGAGNVNWGATSLIIVDGNNSYTGSTTISAAGPIGIGHDSAFGVGGTVTVSSAASVFAFGANRTIANSLSLNADLTFGANSAVYQGFDLTFAGPVTLGASRTITTVAGGRLSLTNVGGGALDLTKAGGGTLALAGTNNSYSGVTNVNAGTLLVNGTLTSGGGLVTVGSAAWLGGGGTINRAATVNSSGTIAPGTSAGMLTVNGNLTHANNSIYFWELSSNTTSGGGVNWDQITMASGDLSIVSGARLIPAFIGSSTLPNGSDAFWQTAQRWDNIIDLTGTATNSSGAAVFAIDNAAWASFGSFATIPAVTGSGIALVWTPVPEPAHILMLCGGAFAGIRVCRRRLESGKGRLSSKQSRKT